MTVIPTAWRDKLTDIWLPETFAAIIAIVSTAYGVVVIVTAPDLLRVLSFRQAFAWAPPHVWGLSMVVLGVLMLGLLAHSRLAAAVPAVLLALAWVAWSLPIIQSPGFVWTAFVIYAGMAALTLATAFSLLVPRRKG